MPREPRKSRSKRRQKSRETPAAARIIDDLPIRKASEVSSHRSYVIYGRAGTGKTTLAATFPGPTLLLDVRDKGTDSISDCDHVDIRDVETWDDFEITYWYLRNSTHKYKTVVIDTMTQVQNMLVEEFTIEKGKSAEKAGDWGTLTKKDWGEIVSRIKIWIMNFRDLPMDVVFLAQDRAFNVDDEEDESEVTPEIGPRLSPSVRATINAAVAIIGNTYIRQRIRRKKNKKTKKITEEEITEYCLRIGPSAIYDTKVRKPKGIVPPDFLVDPTYEDFIELIKGE